MWTFKGIASGESGTGSGFEDNYNYLKCCGAITEAQMPTPEELISEYKIWCTFWYNDADVVKLYQNTERFLSKQALKER